MATIKYENLDIENVDVKEEVDSLENRHHDDVGETRLENIQGQDPLECATPLEEAQSLHKGECPTPTGHNTSFHTKTHRPITKLQDTILLTKWNGNSIQITN